MENYRKAKSIHHFHSIQKSTSYHKSLIEESPNSEDFGANVKIEPDPGAYDGTIKLLEPQICLISSMNTSKIFKNSEIFFVNGIMNNFNDAKESALSIANILGTRLTLIYSMEEKNILKDLITAVNVSSGKEKTLATQMIEIKVRQNLKKNKEVIVIAHSRGAALTKSAIESLIVDRSKIKNLFVITLGGYTQPAETWKTDATVISFINSISFLSDPIPRLPKPFFFHDALLNYKDAPHPYIPNRDPRKIIHPIVSLLQISFEISVLHPVKNYFHCLKKFEKLYSQGFRGKKNIRDSPY